MGSSEKDQRIDSKRRITLPKEFEGGSRVIIQKISDVEFRILKANVVPALSEVSKAMIAEGLEDASAGRISELDEDLLSNED